MTVRTIGMIVTITIGFLANGASAQDDPKVGITMGYPGSIGVIWQVTDRIALRPEVTFSHNSGESTTVGVSIFPPSSVQTTTVSTSDAWQVLTGVSALFYLSRHEALRTYVSPRWAYTRGSGSTSSGIDELGTFGSSTATHTVSGSFGAQYAVAPKFSVFGDVGLAFSRSTSEPLARSLPSFVATSGNLSRTLTMRSGAGVILYF